MFICPHFVNPKIAKTHEWKGGSVAASLQQYSAIGLRRLWKRLKV